MASGISDPSPSSSTERPGPFSEVMTLLGEYDAGMAACAWGMMELGYPVVVMIVPLSGPDCSMYE